ncbi:MAG: LysM peptidoglycan-binding domain-containing protein [Caldilinea sp.]|jgi:LysM repeat protein
MNRRQLAFVILLNALISLTIAVAVVWVVEQQRPDPERLVALATPAIPAIVPPAEGAATVTPAAVPPAAVTPAAVTPAVAAQAEATPSPLPAAGEEIYVVQAGDILSAIAGRYGVSMQAILDANGLSNPDFVFSGQRLIIPFDEGGQAGEATPASSGQASGSGLRVASFLGVGQPGSEALQIANDSDLAVDLQGWRLEKEGGPGYLFGSVALYPGSGVLLYSGTGTDSTVALYWGQPAPLWQPGATARLVNPQGQEMARSTVP